MPTFENCFAMRCMACPDERKLSRICSLFEYFSVKFLSLRTGVSIQGMHEPAHDHAEHVADRARAHRKEAAALLQA